MWQEQKKKNKQNQIKFIRSHNMMQPSGGCGHIPFEMVFYAFFWVHLITFKQQSSWNLLLRSRTWYGLYFFVNQLCIYIVNEQIIQTKNSMRITLFLFPWPFFYILLK